ncbi:hypothetical protein B0H15DRAFT_317542 [Mycena belliarum]|uniref:Uncharacterized protein n=1 Tax=Mycena belliarum TaxID=1033014 RepID=A0AAD6UKL1_9AGAR|nr:hypothetical protein B0H15DRAFT_317542 [Mycena belliae]
MRSGLNLSWFSGPALADMEFGTKVGHTLDPPKQELLACTLFSQIRAGDSTMKGLALDVADSRRRHVAEVRRRLQNNVPVGLSMTPTLSPWKNEAGFNADLDQAHETEARSEIPTLSDAGTPDNQHACAQVQALQNKVQALEKQIAQQHKAHRSEVQLLKNDKLVVEALLEEARGSGEADTIVIPEFSLKNQPCSLNISRKHLASFETKIRGGIGPCGSGK